MDTRTRCAQGVRVRGGSAGLAPDIVAGTAFEQHDQAAVEHYFESHEGYLYARHGSPTVDAVERFLAGLEGAERAVAFGSGMAAIGATLFAHARAGERIAAQRELYGGTVDLLQRVLPDRGVEVVWLDRDELDDLDPERIDGCRLLFLETPTNPTLRLVDLAVAAERAHRAHVIVVVDSTFATPVLQRPLEHGVDLVVHSATKYLGGHGDLMGGAVAGARTLLQPIELERRALGGVLGPFAAFLLHRGLRTLALRMEAHCRGAAAVAEHLSRHEAVSRVHYPALPTHPDRELCRRQMERAGGMVSIELAGGGEAAVRLHDGLRLFRRAGTLGGIESLVSIPARMSHRHLGEDERRRAGVSAAMVRLSVGLESPGDLIADLDEALAG